MDAPAGWIAKHIADVRVVGEPYAGTGMFPAVMWPSNAEIGPVAKRVDAWGLIAWLRGSRKTKQAAKITATMQPKKISKVEIAAGKHDVWTWRREICTAIKNQAPWDKQMTGPVIVQSVFLMPRPQRLKDGGRQPCVRPRWRDVSNLIKASEDATTDSGIWVDDSQVYDHRASRWYAASGEQPGVELTFWELIEKNEASLF